MRQNSSKKKRLILEEMENNPNVSVACKKVGISRNTVYRWCKEDLQFKESLDEASALGTDSINDLAESKIISAIASGNLKASQYWLDNHKKEYMRPRPKDFWKGKNSTPPVAVIEIVSAGSRDEPVEFNIKKQNP